VAYVEVDVDCLPALSSELELAFALARTKPQAHQGGACTTCQGEISVLYYYKEDHTNVTTLLNKNNYISQAIKVRGLIDIGRS
jgi:hypothetical protein